MELESDRSKFCPQCGAENNENWKFCGQCGFELEVPGSLDSELIELESTYPDHHDRDVVESSSPISRPKMILGIIFGAIILLVVYFAFFYAPTANFEILDSNLKMVSNSSSRDISATTINGTIQNTGSSTINIVCVDVYSGNNYVGKFFLTDLKPNDNV